MRWFRTSRRRDRSYRRFCELADRYFGERHRAQVIEAEAMRGLAEVQEVYYAGFQTTASGRIDEAIETRLADSDPPDR